MQYLTEKIAIAILTVTVLVGGLIVSAAVGLGLVVLLDLASRALQ